MANPPWTAYNDSSTSVALSANWGSPTYTIQFGDVANQSDGLYALKESPREECALDWLDRRINEVRVKL